MANLIKQMRVKFSGVEDGNVGETSRVRDRKLSSQKTRSFKGDNRRGQNWYKGQSSSREPRYDDDDSDYMESDEFRTAVAAAAFAINSAEEQRRRTRRRRDDGLKKGKRKQEDGQVSVRPRGRIQLPSSASNKMKNKEDDTVPISTPTLFPKKP
ncbi:hypothetical protein Ccrd_001734, partial [Cynara cardunculus var. scolymus]